MGSEPKQVAALGSNDELKERLASLTIVDSERLGRALQRFSRRGASDSDQQQLLRLLADLEKAEARVSARQALVPEVSFPEELPVSQRRDDIKEAIQNNQVVVVAGETGSGKTTQLPKLCLELGRGVRGTIAHTQPRRIAARAVAERIAHELGVPLGAAVGYSVRFNDRSSQDTLVRLLTDGLLLAEIQRDRLLHRYDTIIVDEAHERSLNIDFLLGYLHRILPKRPDLKLIITSATIDPQRFSKHFWDAPMIEVSGRTFPVEMRYRPMRPSQPSVSSADSATSAPRSSSGPSPKRENRPKPTRRESEAVDQGEAIADAVSELLREGHRGVAANDILVFLSGEREIRDTAEVLRRRFGSDAPRAMRHGPAVDVLPLFARLSSDEQQRVVTGTSGGSARRIVLATNVAETSLTVPGIGYVIDPGFARISRYSPRLKVQRLPIEEISQASANQRAGRCGRTAEGICIRLYEEEEFESRPAFTDPEILRTNLASVILQMAALGLGAIEEFPFLDPPDSRQIRDGVLLLEELGAFESNRGHERRLTELGRKLARLPIDPRLGRMVLEADRLRCLDEVLVIAAALSIQDPRERPEAVRDTADQQHARFVDKGSDFLTYLNLWRYLREIQAELSGNQFRKRCKSEYLHLLRIREWQELVHQLRQATRQIGLKPSDIAAEPDQIHQALLSGLLSQIGVQETTTPAKASAARSASKPSKRRAPVEFTGARNSRFQIFPGSTLSRNPPGFVMVAELVETSRLWGRVAAKIDPAWAERLGEHLVKRSYSEPRWSAKRSVAVANERVTLYGVPLVTSRTVPYGRVDPELSRSLFIRHALVEGQWQTNHRFLQRNGELIAEIKRLEDRARRRDLLVDDEQLVKFYDQRVPQDVVSGADFDRWWKRERTRQPELLSFTRELLVVWEPDFQDGGDVGRPLIWRQGDLQLELSYRFEPGTSHDGVTVHVPISLLPQIKNIGFEWLVPAMRPELLTTLLRGLPKDTRREIVPIPNTVEKLLPHLKPSSGYLPDVLAATVNRIPGISVRSSNFDLAALPAHLRMNFQVEDASGEVIAAGPDLDSLKAQAQPQLRDSLQVAQPGLAHTGLKKWNIGTLPRTISTPELGEGAVGYPALFDEGQTAGVKVMESPTAQAAAMQLGTRRLLLLGMGSPARLILGELPLADQLALAGSPHGGANEAMDDVISASVDLLLQRFGGPAWDAAGFEKLRSQVAGELYPTAKKLAEGLVLVLAAAADVRAQIDQLASRPAVAEATTAARGDVESQLGRLVRDRMVSVHGAQRIASILRYLQASKRRLDRLPQARAADSDRIKSVHELERAFLRRIKQQPQGKPLSPQLRDIPWQLEELRVAQFAPELAATSKTGSRRGTSAKQVREAISNA